MVTVPSKNSCNFCKHVRENKDGWIPCCDAFPDGIPDEFLDETKNASDKQNCNNGIGFVPDVEAQRECGYLK